MMKKKRNNEERVGADESNLRENGTTVDGGFPRHSKWTNPHDALEVILTDVLQIVVICVPLSFIFGFLLELGLGEAVLEVLRGEVPLDGNGIKNIVMLGIFALILIVLPIISVIDAIVYLVRGKRCFALSRPIRKLWNKHRGEYEYRQ